MSRLTGLEREKLAVEYGSLSELIARLRAILADDGLLMEVIQGELQEVRDRYGDARRTEIRDAAGEIGIEDLIADEEVVVTVSNRGYIKRVPLSEYRSQGRGGRGLSAGQTRDEDFMKWVYVINAHAHLLVLTESGKAFMKRVYEIPAQGRAARGRPLVNFVGIGEGERVAAILPIRELERDDAFLVTATTSGASSARRSRPTATSARRASSA